MKRSTTPAADLLAAAQALAESATREQEGGAPDPLGIADQAAVMEAVVWGRDVEQTLAVWGADDALRAAGLLHRLVCIGAIAPSAIARVCAPPTATLCTEFLSFSAMTEPALQKTALASTAPGLTRPTNWRGRHLAYARIRAYCAAYHDPALGFLQAAVLWQRFQMARAGVLERQHYQDEAVNLLGPFLEMLGLRELRTELSRWLLRQDNTPWSLEHAGEIDALTDAIVAHLQTFLPTAEFDTKNTLIHNFDAYNTAVTTQKSGQFPLIEVLVDEPAACYQVLHWIHTLFVPIENALADNIGLSRVNGYRAISTAAMVPADLPTQPEDTPPTAIKEAAKESPRRVRINFRIATREMDEVNRWGLAAFLMRGRLQSPRPPGWWQLADQGDKHIASAPLGSLPEIVYVFSPHGQLFRFQRGATVVDFAYHVHSELADRCSRFYINGEAVEPATVLHHLDLVELEHDPLAAGPTQVWLDAAQTNRARAKIERHLKRTGQGVYHGQRLVEQRRQALEAHYGFSMPEHWINRTITDSMRKLRLTRVEELFAEIAAGRWAADRMLHPFFADEVVRQIKLPRQVRLRPHQLQLAQCCMPKPGDDIIGWPLRRRGVLTGLKIHRRDCPKLPRKTEPPAPNGTQADHAGDGTIGELKWRLQPKRNALARIEMVALNEDGLLGDAVNCIYAHIPRVTLHKVEAVASQGIAHLRFSIEAESSDLIDAIAIALRQLPRRSIDRVQRMNLPPSEQEELTSRQAAGTINPYSRLPVNERAMFFGRAQDLTSLVEWISAGAGSVWLRGQKRVGKTSLLLHLKRFQLEEQGFVPVFVDFQLLSRIDDNNIYFEVASAIYAELQADANRSDLRVGELGAPLRELFVHDPRGQFIAYVRNIQRRMGAQRMVLLLDEFSRTIDAFHQGHIDSDFFLHWRGVMLATMPAISYVTVVQQKTYDRLALQRAHTEIDPIWELLELGEQLVLRQLSDDDVRRLIEWPIRNFLEYIPETVDYVARLTGGSPFLIQAFCFRLVGHMTHQDRRQVTWDDVETVRMEFMQPHESLFSHLLDLIHGIGHTVIQGLAHLAEEQGGGVVSTQALAAHLSSIEPARLTRTLHELAAQDLIRAHTFPPDGNTGWHFTNELFQQWLALNALH